MGTDKRTYRVPLKPEWADALLAAPSTDGRPISSHLIVAREELRKAIEAAQEVITKNPLTETVALAAARELGKRGRPVIVVDPNGEVTLEIHYSASTQEGSSGRPKRAWHSELPSLELLRQEALALGVNVEGTGRSKHLLQAAITKAKADSNRSKRIKTVPALSVVVLNPGGLPFTPAGDLPDDLLRDPDEF